MRLRHVNGSTIKVNWAGTSEFTVFGPVGETTDERGQRLLNNPVYKGQFEEVKTEPPSGVLTFKCDICGEVKKSKAGLGSHKRKHKEIST
jgi:hypothetical protein